MEKAAEGALIVRVLVDVRDAQFRLPEKGMIGAPENLALFRDAADHRLQRGSPVGVAEAPGIDFFDDRGKAPPDGAEVLESLLPQEPASVGCGGVFTPDLQHLPGRGSNVFGCK